MKIEKEEPKNIIAITHSHCHDGAGSAWVIDHYHQEHNVTHYRIYPGNANKFIDEEEINIENPIVFSADIGYTGESLQKLIKRFPNVIVIDHHISSYRSIIKYYNPDLSGEDLKFVNDLNDNLKVDSPLLKKLPSNYNFDNNESGATLTWKYFYPEEPIPLTLQYIKDRDIWKFELPDSHVITTGLYELTPNMPDNNNWESWENFIKDEDINLERCKEVGLILETMSNRRMKELLYKVTPIKINWKNKEWTCGLVNTTEDPSKLGNLISNYIDPETKKHVYDFAIIWKYTNTFICSLRSRSYKDENGNRKAWFDVGEYAEHFGGGGHACASGMTIKNLFKTFSIDLP